MIKAQLYPFLITVLAGLFLSLQIMSFAHANTYGDSPHEHDGTLCVLGALAEDDQDMDVPEPATAPKQRPMVTRSFEAQIFASTSYMTPQGRAPPPRSPPLFTR